MPVTEYVGDIFKAPEGSVLIHSCNCQGVWGSGVAKAFADNFPAACAAYEDHCLIPDTAHHKKWLVGTSLLIPPKKEDAEKSGRYWIACLFTSLNYGAKTDKADAILENTRKAMTHLKMKFNEKHRQIKDLNLYDKLYTVRINSARFGVPWHRTKKLLEQSLLDLHVINNLDVMSQKERDSVIADMKANGFDTETIAFSKDTQQEDDISTPDSHSKKRKHEDGESEGSKEDEAESSMNVKKTKNKKSKKDKGPKKEKKEKRSKEAQRKMSTSSSD